MKQVFGLFILIIACSVFTGCTQQALPEPVTTLPTTGITTVPTTELTTVLTTVPTTVVTTVIPATTRTLSPSTKVITTIHIRNNAFVPSVLTVLPGTGVSWINDDETVHAVKATGIYAGKFNSGDILPGAQWSFTFGTQEGSYEFTDAYHPEINGTIIIMKANSRF